MTTYQHQFQAMASPFAIRIDVYTDAETPASQAQLNELLQKLEDMTRSLERTMSRFDEQSELMHLLRRLNTPQPVSAHLWSVLQLAQQLTVWTEGAFDPTVLKNLEEIGYSGAPLTLPTLSQKRDLALPDNRIPSQTPANIFMETAGASAVVLKAAIDLGGIGKGYTADCLADLIETTLDPYLLAGYIVDAGGDIVLAGVQETAEAWSIGVENPLSPDSLSAVVSPGQSYTPRLAVCTSSLRRKAWSHEGRTVHHIIDPQTGQPAETPLYAVTAVGSRAALTEVVTKYVFLRGFQAAELWHHVPMQCLWITRDGHLGMTEEIQPFVTWTSA